MVQHTHTHLDGCCSQELTSRPRPCLRATPTKTTPTPHAPPNSWPRPRAGPAAAIFVVGKRAFPGSPGWGGPGGPGCPSRARRGSAATATAAAGSSSPSTGERRGCGGGCGVPGCAACVGGRARGAPLLQVPEAPRPRVGRCSAHRRIGAPAWAPLSARSTPPSLYFIYFYFLGGHTPRRSGPPLGSMLWESLLAGPRDRTPVGPVQGLSPFRRVYLYPYRPQ